MYGALRELNRLKSVQRAEHWTSRIAPLAEKKRYAEIVAALKIEQEGLTPLDKRRHRAFGEGWRRDAGELGESDTRLSQGPTTDRMLRSSELDYVRITRGRRNGATVPVKRFRRPSLSRICRSSASRRRSTWTTARSGDSACSSRSWGGSASGASPTCRLPKPSVARRRARRARSSARSAPSRKSTKRSITSTSRRTREREPVAQAGVRHLQQRRPPPRAACADRGLAASSSGRRHARHVLGGGPIQTIA